MTADYIAGRTYLERLAHEKVAAKKLKRALKGSSILKGRIYDRKGRPVDVLTRGIAHRKPRPVYIGLDVGRNKPVPSAPFSVRDMLMDLVDKKESGRRFNRRLFSSGRLGRARYRIRYLENRLKNNIEKSIRITDAYDDHTAYLRDKLDSLKRQNADGLGQIAELTEKHKRAKALAAIAAVGGAGALVASYLHNKDNSDW